MRKFNILCNLFCDRLRVKIPISESKLIKTVATMVYKVLGSILLNQKDH